jgi:L-ascorbate metabolism protein UlaG (beta-lactamase superfamily)
MTPDNKSLAEPTATKPTRRRWLKRLGLAAGSGLLGTSCVRRTLLSAGPGWQGERSDHFDGRLFFNPGANDGKSFGQFLKWKTGGGVTPWPQSVELTATPALPTLLSRGQAAVTFVNHASFLIQLPGCTLLTDPVWSQRVSPVSWAGPQRVRQPGIAWEALPKIDVVLLSHNHYDHWDIPTLRRLHERFQPRFVSGLGNAAFLREIGIGSGEDLDWWQTSKTVSECRLVFAPARHWSNRGGGNKNTTLWGAFWIEHDSQRIYFGGDTGMHTHFAETRTKLGRPSLALLPIGAYEPRWFMASMHLNPAEAVDAHLVLGAERSLGMHYGTWQLTNEGIEQPVLDLAAARVAKGLPEQVFAAAEQGRTLVL